MLEDTRAIRHPLKMVEFQRRQFPGASRVGPLGFRRCGQWALLGDRLGESCQIAVCDSRPDHRAACVIGGTADAPHAFGIVQQIVHCVRDGMRITERNQHPAVVGE